MDNRLNPYFFGKCSTAPYNIQKYGYVSWHVLILIFLENALRHLKIYAYPNSVISLNPYFFGKCSTAHRSASGRMFRCRVLILIFLENALRPRPVIDFNNWKWESLNPYFFGKCSTAKLKQAVRSGAKLVLILIFLENALRLKSQNSTGQR